MLLCNIFQAINGQGVDRHFFNYIFQAINGQGVDRHLLGLKLAAIKNGMNVPSLHMDTTYSTSVHFKVSTSQVSIKMIPFLF